MPKRKAPAQRGNTKKSTKLDSQDGESSNPIVGSIDSLVSTGKESPSQEIIPETSDLPPYDYEPLDLNADSFRLFEIPPGLEGSIIKGSMRNADITQEEYVCLSYTWQPQNPFHNIEIDGMITSIGENLWQFLCLARKLGVEIAIWIDALCIDQSDHKEKNHQVPLMSKIYKSAVMALIWLGADFIDGTSSDFWNLVMECIQKVDERRSTPEEYVEEMISTMSPNVISSMPGYIAKFLSLSYWSRLWIIQEIMLLKDTVIVFGELLMPLPSLAFVFIRLMYHRDSEGSVGTLHGEGRGISYIGLPGHRFLFAKFVMHWRHDPAQKVEKSLPALLRQYRYAGCYNKLDRVYGLLSITENGHQLPVDYDVDKETLFQRAMAFCMDNQYVDEFLLIGASLIEALELRSSPVGVSNPDSTNTTTHKEFLEVENWESSRFSIKYNPQLAIGGLVWHHAVIGVADVYIESPRSETVLCLYMAIYDAGDIHVFEYVVEEKESGITVKYPRAHEYLQGEPRILYQPYDHSDNTSYLWIDLPSERLYYFHCADLRLQKVEDEVLPGTLTNWTAAEFDLEAASTVTTDHNSTMTEIHSPRLRPARRKIELEEIWTKSIPCEPSLFWSEVMTLGEQLIIQLVPPTKPEEEEELNTYLEFGKNLDIGEKFQIPSLDDGWLEIDPPSSRCTSFRFEHKRRGPTQP